MANPFDQFGGGGAETAPSNPFDQFDPPKRDVYAEEDKPVSSRAGLPELPWWLRKNTQFGRLQDQLTHGQTFGLDTEVAPVSYYLAAQARRAAGLPASSENPEMSAADVYHQAKQKEIARIEQGRGEFGLAPQLVGGLAAFKPGVATAGAVPSAGSMFKTGAKIGTSLGAVQGATEGDGTLGERLANTATGAGVGLGAGLAGTALGYGIGQASGIIGRATSDAANAEQAANRRIAEAYEDSGIDLDKVRDVIAPGAKRATTDAQVSEIVQRANAGQTRVQIAAEMGLTPYVVSERLAQFAGNTRVPTNMVDATKLVAKEASRAGADMPVTELAQTAAGLGGKGTRIAAERLAQRHVEQPQRIADALEMASKGPSLAEAQGAIEDALDTQARAAYKAAEQNAKSFDLQPVIRKYRDVERLAAGEIKSGLSKAIDLFYEPGEALAEGTQTITGPGGTKVIPGTPSADKPITFTKFGSPISDLPKYQEAKDALDQIIQRSFQDGRPTRLTSRLTQFRREIDQAVKDANPDYKAADALFSGAKSAQNILDKGQEAVLRAGQKQGDSLDFFRSLNPTQQELFRAAFKQRLINEALNTTKGGSNPARQYTSKAAQDFLSEIFPGKEGDRLLTDLAKENVSVETLRDIFSGSRTAPLLNRMNEFTEGAHLAGDLVTANVPGLLRRVGNRVASGISGRQAEEVLDRLTNTDPSKILPFIESVKSAGALNKAIDQRVANRAFRYGNLAGTGARNIAESQALGESKPNPTQPPKGYPQARRAADGKWYVPRGDGSGKYYEVRP